MAFLDFEISVPLFPAEKNLQSLQQDFTSLSEIGDPDVTVLVTNSLLRKHKQNPTVPA
jgi:hypothetical protein